jgi:hypothetical protein
MSARQRKRRLSRDHDRKQRQDPTAAPTDQHAHARTRRSQICWVISTAASKAALSRNSPRRSAFGGHLRAPEAPETRLDKPRTGVSGALESRILGGLPLPLDCVRPRRCRLAYGGVLPDSRQLRSHRLTGSQPADLQLFWDGAWPRDPGPRCAARGPAAQSYGSFFSTAPGWSLSFSNDSLCASAGSSS